MLLYFETLLYLAEIAKTFGPPIALVPPYIAIETLGEFRYIPKLLASSAAATSFLELDAGKSHKGHGDQTHSNKSNP